MGARLTPSTSPSVNRRSSENPSIAFAGTPAFAADILESLMAAGHVPQLVLTQPDRRAGRGRKPAPSAVKQVATEASLPVETPNGPADIFPALASTKVDVLVVAAYGLLLPRRALDHPRLGCVNVHASLLPRWRGAAPVERAMIAGDPETGVSIMRMEEGLDTGPVYKQARIPIESRATGQTLENALSRLGADLLLDVLPDLERLAPDPQSGPATYARKLGPHDSVADWTESASNLDRRIRALAHRAPVRSSLGGTRVQLLSAMPREESRTAEPGTVLPSGRREILVACGSGALAVDSLKVNRGKGRTVSSADARNGFPDLFRPGARFQ